MIKEQFFPTTIYGKDIKLDNRLFEKEIIDYLILHLYHI